MVSQLKMACFGDLNIHAEGKQSFLRKKDLTEARKADLISGGHRQQKARGTPTSRDSNEGHKEEAGIAQMGVMPQPCKGWRGSNFSLSLGLASPVTSGPTAGNDDGKKMQRKSRRKKGTRSKEKSNDLQRASSQGHPAP